MIWLASYPRSGNTFVRNILHDVYGMTSGEYHIINGLPFDERYTEHPFVKTHLLPWEIIPEDPGIKAVYLVRDGRDSIVSMAHQRSDIIAPGSVLYQNMKEAILAEQGSYFSGWSANVKAWVERCDLIIRYEDLIADPLGQIERIRDIIELPDASPEKLLSFEASKKGAATYGTRKEWGYSEDEAKKLAAKIFRKGKAGSWKHDMPDDLHELFWAIHGDTMGMLGYTRNGHLSDPDQDLDHVVCAKMGIIDPHQAGRKHKILIEANKLASNDNDGVKRYVTGLVNGLAPVCRNKNGKWEIDLLVDKDIHPLSDYLGNMEKEWNNGDGNDAAGTGKKPRKGFFGHFENTIKSITPEKWIKWLNDKNILIFHKSYDLLKKLSLFLVYWLRYILLFPLRLIYTQFLRVQHKKEQKALAGNFTEYDLIHVPLQQHYWPFRFADVPMLFTIHDFTHKLFPRFHTGVNIRNAEAGLDMIKQKQTNVLAVSGSTLSDCERFLPLPEDHFHMVYESLEEDKFMMNLNGDEGLRVKEKYGINPDMPFILLLGTIEPRKNIANSIEAFQLMHKRNNRPDVGLVIAGKRGWKMEQHAGYNSYITFTGFVDDEDLSILYSEALALSYVSFYEGFGLPLLEAMRCGTPVIYGNNSSMPEVAGEGGLAADPNDIEDICSKYEMMYFDEGLRNELGLKALKQSNKFSPRQSTLELLKVYKAMIPN